jgi:hypothetical protein
MAVPAKRTTAHQPASRERPTANDAVALGTRGREPAGARVHGREEQLIAADTAEHYPLSDIDGRGPIGRRVNRHGPA